LWGKLGSDNAQTKSQGQEQKSWAKKASRGKKGKKTGVHGGYVENKTRGAENQLLSWGKGRGTEKKKKRVFGQLKRKA